MINNQIIKQTQMNKKENNLVPRSILCVCLGNICRSPTAEAVLRQITKKQGLTIHIDSAGTSAHHVGEPPDSRSQHHAKKRGYDLSTIHSRQVTEDDIIYFDVIFAMDTDNHTKLKALQQKTKDAFARRGLSPHIAEIYLFSHVDTTYPDQPIPDPYYGGASGFDQVLDRCESAANAWINHWQDS